MEALLDRKLLRLDPSARQLELVYLVEAHETVIAAAGRQGGKSLVAAAALVHNLLLRPDLDEIAGGATRHGLCVANSREQASIVLGYCRRLIERSPLLRSRLVNASADRLIFRNGAILALPCQDRLTRGLSASFVCLDELAHFLNDGDGPRAADKVWTAVRPSLTVFGEQGRTLAISTPLGTDGLFHDLHMRAGAGELGNAAAFTATTEEMNPRVSRDFLEGERLVLGHADFEREYEARFTGGGGQFFERDAVAAVVGRHQELPASEGAGWLVAFDPSFSIDPSAAAVVGRSRHDREQLLVARVERWLPSASRRVARLQSLVDKQAITDRVLDDVAALSASFGHCAVVTDQHLPAVVVEGLKRRGVSKVIVRTWTPQSQTDAFRALRARVYSGRVTLPQCEQLVSELCRLRTKLRAGQSQIEIPRSGGDHCDLAVALASAVHEIDSRGVTAPFRTSGPHHARDPLRRRRPTPLGRASSDITYGSYTGTFTSHERGTSIGLPGYSRAAIEQLHRRLRRRRV
jgi:phage terminase large subunit-like protein